jgi:hypothetical protein
MKDHDKAPLFILGMLAGLLYAAAAFVLIALLVPPFCV